MTYISVYPLTLGDIYVGIPFNLERHVGLPLTGLKLYSCNK